MSYPYVPGAHHPAYAIELPEPDPAEACEDCNRYLETNRERASGICNGCEGRRCDEAQRESDFWAAELDARYREC